MIDWQLLLFLSCLRCQSWSGRWKSKLGDSEIAKILVLRPKQPTFSAENVYSLAGKEGKCRVNVKHDDKDDDCDDNYPCSILCITNAELMRDDDDREDNDNKGEDYENEYHSSILCITNAV